MWKRKCITFRNLGKFGRLGNQLFQIAATIALAKRNNHLYLFPTWEYAADFNLKDCFKKRIKTRSEYEYFLPDYTPIPFEKSLNLQGYFQSERYFEDYVDEIRTFLTPRFNFPEERGSTSLHVRRGDYLKYPDHHPFPGINYYEKALEQLNPKRVLVFSDDITWCKDHFKGNTFNFVEGMKDSEDLGLMAKCDDHIIANSSFSWWASWLNPRAEKKVIAPKEWFGPTIPYTIGDRLPKSWILL